MFDKCHVFSVCKGIQYTYPPMCTDVTHTVCTHSRSNMQTITDVSVKVHVMFELSVASHQIVFK